MLKAMILAAAVATGAPAPPPDLSPETQALIAPVAASIAKVKAEQATLPPPKDDVERLLRMQALEQAPRAALGQIDFSRIPAADRKNAMTAIWRQITPVDEANQKALLAMLPSEGWFTIGKYGKPAARAAFLIVQHGDLELWRRFVPVLAPLVAKGEVEGGAYALMFDRLAINEGRPQRYGSQMKCEAGRFVAFPIEDPPGLDARRAALGMPPHADYLKNFENSPPCGG